MKTISAALSSLDEAKAKIQEQLAIAVEVMHRLPLREEEAIRADFVIGAHQVVEAETPEQLFAALCRLIHDSAAHLHACPDLSHVGRQFSRWLDKAETRVHRFEKTNPRGFLPFILETAVGPRQKVQDFESELLTVGVEHSQKVKATPSVSDYGSKSCAFCPDPTAVSRFMQKWPRLWKASLLSLLGLIDMGVWVGEAIERTVAGLGASSVTQKAALLRCWNRVEQAIDIQSFSALKTLLRRVRRERERDFLNNLRSLKGQPAAKEPIDVGYAERAIGLEEFLLKIMIEMAANALQDGGRVSTGLKEFGSVHQLIEEHIKVVGAEAAEASAMNLVLQTVKAEENYLRLCHTWGKSTQKQILDQARQAKEYHEAHCAVIDGYMELSDSKSLRGVMLCYELPIFTQLLYDQRKRLDKALKEQTREDRVC